MTTYAVHSWGTLPTDWGAEIYMYLDVHSLAEASKVCTTWKRFLVLRHFMTSGSLDLSRFSHLNDSQFSLFITFIRNKQTPGFLIRSVCFKLSRGFNFDNAAESLTSLQYLERIVIIGCAELSITKISALTTLPLKDLCFTNCRFSDAGVLDLLEQIPLESLSLCNSKIKRLPSLNVKSLRTLDISYTDSLNQSCMAAIAQLTSLTALNLKGCMWIEDLSPLQKNTSLISLSLYGTFISNPDLKKLPTQLKHLDLSQCNFITDITGLQIERPSLKIEQENERSQLLEPAFYRRGLPQLSCSRQTRKKRTFRQLF